ncbi:MAG: hypothetical protein L6416_12465 [Candidatus Omnitrophica bacterium]|nr:hypothetical protein [Candidatus Omnitrophota bacterium]
MQIKTYLLAVTMFFSIVSIFHLLRLVFRWNAVISGWTIPLWISLVGCIISGILAYMGFKLSKRN